MALRISTTAATLALSLLLAAPVRAGLLNSDSADPVAPQHAEVELNGSYTLDKARSSGATAKCHSTDSSLTITAGLAAGTDIALALPYTLASREKVGGSLARRSDGLNDLTVDLKFRFIDMNGLKLALRPGLLLPTGKVSDGLSDGRVGLTTALLATGEVAGGKLLLHANGGYQRHNYRNATTRDSNRADVFSFSLAGEAEIAAGLTLAVDIGVATATSKMQTTPPAYGLIGASYTITDRLDAYLGGKAGLTTSEDDFTALCGAVYKF